jgi:hypothetical protein
MVLKVVKPWRVAVRVDVILLLPQKLIGLCTIDREAFTD